MASRVKRLDYHSGGQGYQHCSCKSLQKQDLEELLKSGVIKSVIITGDPENEQLFDVVSAWSSLPPNIREAIILLVQQYVQ